MCDWEKTLKCEAIEGLFKILKTKDAKNPQLENNIVAIWFKEYPCIKDCKILQESVNILIACKNKARIIRDDGNGSIQLS
jgi:hypothetical protein